MDGVLVREGTMIPGADTFLERLRSSGRSFLILTNNSAFTPRDLSARLETIGLEVPEEQLWTSALATAKFVADQRPGGPRLLAQQAGDEETHRLGERQAMGQPGQKPQRQN